MAELKQSVESELGKVYTDSNNLYAKIDNWNDRVEAFGKLDCEKKAITFFKILPKLTFYQHLLF